jgi:hypothetical protein
MMIRSAGSLRKPSRSTASIPISPVRGTSVTPSASTSSRQRLGGEPRRIRPFSALTAASQKVMAKLRVRCVRGLVQRRDARAFRDRTCLPRAKSGLGCRAGPSSRSASHSTSVGPTMSPSIHPLSAPKIAFRGWGAGVSCATGLPRLVMTIVSPDRATSSSRPRHFAFSSDALMCRVMTASRDRSDNIVTSLSSAISRGASHSSRRKR